MRHDLRRHPRNAIERKVQISWSDERGRGSFTLCRCIESGMRLDSPEPVPIRTYINFRMVESRFEGSRSVRNCYRKGTRHHIGVEFSGGLRWKLPAKEAGTEPAS